MFSAYALEKGQLAPLSPESLATTRPAWVDLVGVLDTGFKDMIRLLESDVNHSLHSLFNVKTLKKIANSRDTQWVMSDEKTIHFKILLVNPGKLSRTELMVITLHKNFILTFRENGSDIFSSFNEPKHEDLESVADLLHALFTHLISSVALLIQNEIGAVDQISQELFGRKNATKTHNNRHMRRTIQHIGHISHLSTKMQQCLLSFDRVLQFILTDDRVGLFVAGNVDERLKLLVEELRSLQILTSFLTQNLAYLSQTGLSIVNTNQNDIILFLSVLASVLAPPGLIAGIFAAQFSEAPWESWMLGLPIMLGCMIISAFITYRKLRKQVG